MNEETVASADLIVTNDNTFNGNCLSGHRGSHAGALDIINSSSRSATTFGCYETKCVIGSHCLNRFVLIEHFVGVDVNRTSFVSAKINLRVKREDRVGIANCGCVGSRNSTADAIPVFAQAYRLAKGNFDVGGQTNLGGTVCRNRSGNSWGYVNRRTAGHGVRTEVSQSVNCIAKIFIYRIKIIGDVCVSLANRFFTN